jgi:hypothetical protein
MSTTRKGTTEKKKAASRRSTTKKPAAKKSAAKSAVSKKRTPSASGAKARKASAGAKKGSAKSSPRKTLAKKTGKTGKTAKSARRSASRQTRGIFTVLALLIAAGIAGAGLYAWLQPKSSSEAIAPFPSKDTPVRKSRQFEKKKGAAVPPAAVADEKIPPGAAPAPAETVAEPRAVFSDDRPLGAIIIDDFGDDLDIAERFFSLDAPLTYAILPHTRHHRRIAEAAFSRGYEVMLHLPMEPNGYPVVDPGPGSLLAGMTPDERIRQLEINIEAIPHLKGVNNHMGSKMTAISDQMNQVFTVMKKKGLFFVDSRTTAATQCRSSARLFDVPFAERDVFLDHVPEREQILRKIEEFVNVAQIRGKAVAIGHAQPLTVEVLAEVMPELNERVRLVPASRLVQVN